MKDPYNLTMVARVNGEEWSRGSSGTMHHKFEDMIAHVSRDETIYAGEFFGSGTVGGGCGLEQARFLKPGDVVELEVEGLGTRATRCESRLSARRATSSTAKSCSPTEAALRRSAASC